MSEAEAPDRRSAPFAAFLADTRRLSAGRAAIAAAARAPETECLPPLIEEAASVDANALETRRLASALLEDLRTGSGSAGLAASLFVEFGLSSHEGVALMCLAEALLRIPDAATRDTLIHDKIAQGDWARHLGHSRSLFVNAAAWGLVTGKFVTTAGDAPFSGALARLIARGGEPIVRAGVDFVMRLLSEHFVMGQTIEAALARSRAAEARGYRHSYDMLGEAALTRTDADRYFHAYAHAIEALGAADRGVEVHDRPGVSIKLSALHPRYDRAQRARLTSELAPALAALAALARRANIGVNIDAEESNRLDLSLDLFELLCAQPGLAGWDGLGFVVQAYQKRAPKVVDYLIELARRSGRRLMVRLVKGAYWDSEIKRAQTDGLDFPVFTRKVHTDVCYLACARRLLAATDAVFPQFATHNAQTAAAVRAMAGPDFQRGDWEFQCLHGMGEALYDTAMRSDRLDRPCCIYAPVGAHDALLPYLVRRLLENGANASFVRRSADPSVPVETLVTDPVEEARRIAPLGAPNPRIRAATDLFAPGRRNSRGCDLADERTLALLADGVAAASASSSAAAQNSADQEQCRRAVVDPADRSRILGRTIDASAAETAVAVAEAAEFAPLWGAVPPRQRADVLLRAADLMEARRDPFVSLITREAGRTIPDALGEMREAVDFLRYYAAEAASWPDDGTRRPLGPVACVSPWNFPLSIFTGQVAAALAAGNCVLAKPAEETPLVAREAVGVLHEAGAPARALRLLLGDGATGAALVADARIEGVLFTGSTEAARAVNRSISQRLGKDGRPVPLVAETGGQNAMIVDSSALPQQVALDVLASAFDSAGQRCSSLRILCLQNEIADYVLDLLVPAMRDLVVGPPDRLATDVGPLINEEARGRVEAHLAHMRSLGRRVEQGELPGSCASGAFVAPALVEIAAIDEIRHEVFGPVLHVLRYPREKLDQVLDALEATGYGLTFAVHSRIDAVVARILSRRLAGNLYVNRNMIGAVVGVQPFGGHGLSGTGPKAGGPLYLRRLLATSPLWTPSAPAQPPPLAAIWRNWLERRHDHEAIDMFDSFCARSPLGETRDLPGPDGERNVWELRPRGTMLCLASDRRRLIHAIGAALAVGNKVLLRADDAASLGEPPPELGAPPAIGEPARFDAILFQGSDHDLIDLAQKTAARPGPLVPIYRPRGPETVELEWLAREFTTSVNSAAAGGAVDLMAL